MPYIGRFAPSPTGPLHAGSLVAALASWLDARAHADAAGNPGRWLVRIEDVDVPRSVPGADALILQQLTACGLVPDEPPLYQSKRSSLYLRALNSLVQRSRAYPCACSRRTIELALEAQGLAKSRNGELVYPGACRPAPGKPPLSLSPSHSETAHQHHAWRLRVPEGVLLWQDRRLGLQQQDIAAEVGDFVLLRADGFFAYQLAVVMDDMAQGVTHVVRGEDLTDNTPRQILLFHSLGKTSPAYLHTPLVLGANGEKLSKQNGAQALDVDTPAKALAALNGAAHMLGLAQSLEENIPDALAVWVKQWREIYNPAP